MRFNHGRHYGRKGVAHEEKFLRYRHGGSHGGFGGRGKANVVFLSVGSSNSLYWSCWPWCRCTVIS